MAVGTPSRISDDVRRSYGQSLPVHPPPYHHNTSPAIFLEKKKNPHEQIYFPNDPRYLIRIKKFFSRVLLEKIVNTNVNVMTGRQLCKYCPFSLKKIITDLKYG